MSQTLHPGMVVIVSGIYHDNEFGFKNGDRVTLLREADCFCCWWIKDRKKVHLFEEYIRVIPPLELLAEAAE